MAKMAKRSILVVGRSGQLATALAEGAGGDVAVNALGRDQLDMQRPEVIAEVVERLRPDGVINASAYNAVDVAEREPEAAFALNGEGPTALARACAQVGAPLVHVSTDYVFSGEKNGPYIESDPTSPVNAYGRSKVVGEEGVLAAGGEAAVVRTAWVFSAVGKNFVTMMLSLAQRARDEGRDYVRVVEDEVGRPTYAPDLAFACVAVLQGLWTVDAGARGVLHYCGADEVSRADYAEAIFAGAAERGLPTARVERITAAEFGAAAPRPSRTLLDTARITALPGVEVHEWRGRLALCLDRLAAHGN